MLLVVFVALLIALSAANGGNDVSKGVATLAGAGATAYRTAVIWGTVTTLAGCLVSLVIAGNMTALFSSGIVAAKPTDGFAIAVLAATGLWVALATWLSLPVSTTHALVGALVGAGIQLAPGAVKWGALPAKVVYPLIASIFVAYLLSMALALVAGFFTRARRSSPAPVPVGSGGLSAEAATARAPHEAPADASDGTASGRVVTAAHWISSGATSFARGLNDTPKLVAVGSFALVPAGMSTNGILFIVAFSMAAGALAVGMRVARRLGEDVVKMSHTEGLRANVTTAVLVGFGAQAGLPMSTTQVSAGAIAGSAGLQLDRIKFKTLRDFLIGWTITPAFAAGVAWLLGLILI
ncbi:inorganic phosphate transporter [Microbispora sp. RL4-1S]|uniref:Inorganic phosphate transporter n=1 Tax=Microbispora oryzae TaxID=2806554 RepID=A0A940WGB2_9ACTN|nr:inorganic phosphate transporter [Microbispora oryzae]MBP2704243.1 inorganic phosphate transporter [Microbispora oryzae]